MDIQSLLERLSFLAATPAILGVFVTLGMALVSQRWQVQVLGLTILYFFVGLLHTQVIRPEVALIKALIGWFICLTLYITGRYIDTQSAEHAPKGKRWGIAPDMPLRLLVLLAAFVIAYASTVRIPFPQVPPHVGFACYLLIVTGLFLTGMSEKPMQVGIGLISFLTGFDLFFGALEPSLAVAGLIGAVNFLVTLATTFMAVTNIIQEGQTP